MYQQFPTKITDLVKTYNIIPEERVDEMLSWFLGKQKGLGYPVRSLKPELQDPTPIFEWISEITQDVYGRYVQECPGPIDDLELGDFVVRVYPPNEGESTYKFDQNVGESVNRLFSVTIYLNTVEEGGETEFPNYGLASKPVKGKVLIFPCNYVLPHQDNIPISEAKYVATSYINWRTS